MKNLEKISLNEFENAKIKNVSHVYGGGEGWTAVITGSSNIRGQRADNPEWDTWSDEM